jgi:23S rRNA pseudouridine1911/1915/1917 synthase
MPDYSQLPGSSASGTEASTMPSPMRDDASAVGNDAAATPSRQLVARGFAGLRLDQFLAAQLDGISRSRVQRWIALGAVRVDQALRLPSYRLNGHEVVEVEPQPLDSEQAFAPDPVPLDILHRDDDLLIVNKPAGLVTHPAPGNWRGTLMNGLLFANPRSARLPRAGIVHRLDRDTSGVLVCAQSERAFVSLSAQLAERTMQRQYLAIVGGASRVADHGTVDAPIGRDPHNRLRMAVVPPPHGKPAQTDYRVLARRADGQDRHAALACRLRTGRTHQIRVHLASIGQPLVGDRTYGGEAVAGFERQALHAWRLSLLHPASGRPLAVDCPLPGDIRQLAESLGLAIESLAPRPEGSDRPAGEEDEPPKPRVGAKRRKDSA